MQASKRQMQTKTKTQYYHTFSQTHTPKVGNHTSTCRLQLCVSSSSSSVNIAAQSMCNITAAVTARCQTQLTAEQAAQQRHHATCTCPHALALLMRVNSMLGMLGNSGQGPVIINVDRPCNTDDSYNTTSTHSFLCIKIPQAQSIAPTRTRKPLTIVVLYKVL
jgi:hypothetical protein